MPKRPDSQYSDELGELIDHVYGLTKAGRYRSAMDEVLTYLRHHKDAHENSRMRLLAHTLLRSRTDRLQAEEPTTDEQLRSALIAPFLTQCSQCERVGNSMTALSAELGMEKITGNPAWLQCQRCRYTLCRDCFTDRRDHSSGVDAPNPLTEACPQCRELLSQPVLATGRKGVIAMDPETIEAVAVVRHGPIPPTMSQVLTVVTQLLPLLADDEALVHIKRAPSRLPEDEWGREKLARSLVQDLERDGVVRAGAWQRAERHVTHSGSRQGPAHVLVVIRKPDHRMTVPPVRVEAVVVLHGPVTPGPLEVELLVHDLEDIMPFTFAGARLSLYGGGQAPSAELGQFMLLRLEDEGEVPRGSLERAIIRTIDVGGSPCVVIVVPAAD
ncbi:hypothetical protein ABZX95_27740 [Streptomyces sp. NPDC004232]|uniref:hypothetical protein n=1 Tax=Streptomyces sp. NPDC004232 TaxID=3154454 RepID=UPI0033BCAD9B